MKNNKGISLVILVITIIVMIILGGTVIISLTNNGIMDRAKQAVTATNLSSVQQLATMLWAEAYLDGADEVGEFEAKITEGLKDYDTSTYKIKVTLTGVDVSIKSTIPEEWATNVVDIVDGVPIPKGFTVSPYSGENKQATGLVIYQLNDNEEEIPSTESHHTSLTTRNQYVWIPVDKTKFDTTFVRKNFSSELIVDNSGNYYEIGTSGKAWEVVPTSNASLVSSNYDANTLAEAQAMYASVEEYGGFYVSRYEAGVEIGTPLYDPTTYQLNTNVYSMMNKAPRVNTTRFTSVQIARSLYTSDNTKYGVVSTLMYGVQWDRILSWWLETSTKDMDGNTIDILNSVSYGNNLSSNIELSTFNEGAKYSTDEGENYSLVTTGKSSGTDWLLTTGASRKTSVKNIYDMGANVWEWTMEGFSNQNQSVQRGGSHSGDLWAESRSASFTHTESRTNMGLRYTLYIKMQ